MKFTVDDLVAKKLVTKKTYTEGPFAGLSVLKYKNNVFWDNLWHTDSRLLDCRGMVVDAEDNVVIWPFTKIFNRFENGTDVSEDKLVTAVRKVNGFMAAASIHNGDWLVSTTGTLDSEFAKLAKKHINFGVNPKLVNSKMWENMTLIFEICDDSDPHIVHEKPGAYLIGARDHRLGKMIGEPGLDALALEHWHRPEWDNMFFSDVVKVSKYATHEGFVVRDKVTGELLLKIKSPHYLTKKFFMRGGVKKCEAIWDHGDRVKQIVEEEYYPLVDFIKTTFTKDQWLGMNEQSRGKVIEDYFSEKENL